MIWAIGPWTKNSRESSTGIRARKQHCQMDQPCGTFISLQAGLSARHPHKFCPPYSSVKLKCHTLKSLAESWLCGLSPLESVHEIRGLESSQNSCSLLSNYIRPVGSDDNVTGVSVPPSALNILYWKGFFFQFCCSEDKNIIPSWSWKKFTPESKSH